MTRSKFAYHFTSGIIVTEKTVPRVKGPGREGGGGGSRPIIMMGVCLQDSKKVTPPKIPKI